MNKILKILSILVIGFVMFSCSTPTNDPTLYVPEPSGPETPVETPSDDPVEETPEPSDPETPAPNPEIPTYSITFKIEDSDFLFLTDYLNSLPEFKNLKEGTEVKLYKHIYCNLAYNEFTTKKTDDSAVEFTLKYYNNSEIDLVVIGNEDVEVEMLVCSEIQFRDY